MSKPDFNGLGITAELTLHERALRAAQNEITALKAENARLREQMRQLEAKASLRVFHQELREALGRDENPLIAQSINLPGNIGGDPISPPLGGPYGIDSTINMQGHTHQFPPHHSTVGIDGEGRVQG